MVQTSFTDFTGFDWDDGNRDKNRAKHHVECYEGEQVFLNKPIVVLPDKKHSSMEKRFSAFGITDAGRQLTVIFIKRRSLIRIISARDMNKKEKEFYRYYEQKNS
jgi:hypothetical protein